VPADKAAPALDSTVWAVGRQTHETLAFLGGLTGYNVTLADHVLAALPADVSGDDLARQLTDASDES
jgi:hypothetical protein